MVFPFVIEDGDDSYLVEISTGKDVVFATEEALCDAKIDITVAEIGLGRIKGNSTASMKALSYITKVIASFIYNNDDVILYYYCDDTLPLPNKAYPDNMTVQEYRSRLFAKMFERYVSTHNLIGITDTPIYIDALGWPLYMHLIARDEHLVHIEKLKTFVSQAYGK